MQIQEIMDMPRITRAYFCKNFDEVLDRASDENTGFVIYEEAKDDLILCPASWFDIALKKDIKSK